MGRLRHMHSASVFVALMQGSEICLLRRKATGWLDGQFSLPAGGLDAGETIASAARREAEEEVGVWVAPSALHYAHTLHSQTDGSDWVGHFFVATEWSGIPRICETDKHCDLMWRAANALPDETIPYVRQALRCIAQGDRYSEYGWPLSKAGPC
ncbi:NUDIX hydrolase [Neoroseomonas alba]|nr:NUDIX domain-containing protein [Neoroseomonas alba]